MTSSRLKAMQAAFAPKSNDENRGSNRYYPMGKVDLDTAVTVRFLPDKNPDNQAGFLKEVIMHNLMINGSEKRVPCLEMWGETCPICEQAKQFFNANQNEQGSRIWKKRNYVAQVLVIDDPLKLEIDASNPIKIVSIGKQVLSIIKEAIVSGEIENDPDAYVGGHNFIIKKTKGGAKPGGDGFFPTYNVGTRFSSKPTDVPEELRDVIDANLIDLSDLVPQKPDAASVYADLQASLTGGSAAPRASRPPQQAPRQQAPADDGDGDEEAPFPTAATPAPAVQSTTADLLARLKRGV